MSHPCQWPVYVKRIDEPTKKMIAIFRNPNDAIKWSIEISASDFRGDTFTIYILNPGRRVFRKYQNGFQK